MKYIFLSSSYQDLKIERKYAIETIDRLEFTKAIAMERISSNPNIPKDVCLSELSKCHMLILILGFNYGSIDPDERISITEIEYNEAVRRNIPILVFKKVDPEGIWNNNETDLERCDKLGLFLKKLDSAKWRNSFKTPEELSIQILTSIRNYEIENGEIGIINPQFQGGDEFFEPFADSEQIFNHTHSFQGKDYLIEQMDVFLDSKTPLLLIHGRGGIGKSKILYEFYRRHSTENNYKFWFLRMNAELQEESFRQLPLKRKNIIIVDDAHHQPNLINLLAVAKKYSSSIKLIFTSRNYGMDYINAQIFRCGFEIEDVELIPEITELRPEEMEKLADSILDFNHKQYLKPLISVARDSPLVLVIGAKLINKDSIDPLLLERSRDFQSVVLAKFRDIKIGKIGDDPDMTNLQDFLYLISAIQPINLEKTELIEKMSYFLKRDKFKIILTIGKLEKNGILIKRGNVSRITPDVLSDFILSEACVSNNHPTGYAIEVFEHFYPIAPLEVISNIAELDWRLNVDGSKINVMAEIWPKIFKDIETGSNFKRTQILKNLEKVAYFQPGKTFKLIQYVLENPSNKDIEFSEFFYYNEETVKMAIPIILRNISFSIEYLPDCCDILWELGRDKKGTINSDPEHPIRVLQEITEYGIGKYVKIQLIVLDSIEKWLNEPNCFDHLYSPLDIIGPILKKDGEDTSCNGRTITSKSFAISYENTQNIRIKAILLLKDYLYHQSLKVQLKALKVLFEALNPPRSLYGRQISIEEYQCWLPEEILILEIFEDLVKNTTDPVIKLDIYNQLEWHTKYGKNAEKCQIAQRIRSGICDDFNLKLHRVLLHSFDDALEDGYSVRLNKIEEFIKNFGKEFVVQYPNPQDSYTIICDLLLKFHLIEREVNPGRFFYILGKDHPEYTIAICKKIISDPISPMSRFYSSLVSGLMENNSIAAKYAINEGLISDNLSVKKSIVWGFAQGWSKFGSSLEELSIIKGLLGSSDLELKCYALESLAQFDNKFNDLVKGILIGVNIGDSLSLANALCKSFVNKEGKDVIILTDEEISSILLKFLEIKNFNHIQYVYLCKFFNKIAKECPKNLIDFFLLRISKSIECKSRSIINRFHPLPDLLFSRCINDIIQSSNYQDILRKLMYESLEKRKRYYCGRLFEMISGNFSPKCVEILSEWLDSQEETKLITISELLREAKTEFLFREIDFIDKLLTNSKKINHRCFKKIQNNLINIVNCEPRTGELHQPFSLDIQIKDKSEEIAEKFPMGSLTRDFYLSLAKHAEIAMIQAIKMDEYLISE